ncbi:MAG: hypothetical protein GOU98_01010 [Candidatus Altiarchaeota archaeon]|nr:hypothetical protein [Candidatus Altiarchaeota archaeon]
MIVKQVPAVIIYAVVVIGAIAIFVAIENSKGSGIILNFDRCDEIVFKDYTTDEKEASIMFEKINQFRVSNNKSRLEFSNEAYQLAEFRAKDMVDFEYYAYTNPATNSCAENIRTNYRITDHVSESIYGQDIDRLSPCAIWEDGNIQEVLDEWFSKESTKNNILYANHIAGAVNCFWDKCSFIALNSDGHGNKCIA